MKIKLAQYYGFCSGVKRAVRIAFNQQGKSNVYTLGELLHNPQFIKRLESINIKTINSINEIKKGTIIIRAHGVPVQIIKNAKRKGLKIIDATCPKVKKVHQLASKLKKDGYKVVIFGDKTHPEVVGIASNVVDPIIINSEIKAKKIKHYKKIGLVSQTTQQEENFKKIKKILKNKAQKFISYNTICSATQKRQNAARKLAEKTDIVIVIGGKHSSNTQKLKKICSEITPTYHIETAKELKSSWFKNKKICGVTAGASTPKWVIDGVMKQIKKY